MIDQPNAGLPERITKAWRLWLLTGSRRERIDRRRLRGAHLGLKRVLGEDTLVRGEPPYGWKEFSDAMLRQAIGDAVRMLPETDGRLLKLAYFGGYSNRDIALDAGLSEAAVATRLRRALDIIADRIQRSGSVARRAVYAIAAWFCGRACEGPLQHAVQASVVAVAAVIVVAAGPAPTSVPARESQPPPVPALVVRSDVTTAAHSDPSAQPGDSSPATPTSAAPVAPVVIVTAPALPVAVVPLLPTVPHVAVPRAPAAPSLPQLPLRA